MQKSLPLLFLFVLVLAGCDSETNLTSNSLEELQVSTGILEGKVSIGPLCPVEGPGIDCEPKPELFTSHQLVITRPDGAFVTNVNLDGQGNYRTELAAGTYHVDFTPHDIGIGEFVPLEVVIEAGLTTRLDIEIDTGIR